MLCRPCAESAGPGKPATVASYFAPGPRLRRNDPSVHPAPRRARRFALTGFQAYTPQSPFGIKSPHCIAKVDCSTIGQFHVDEVGVEWESSRQMHSSGRGVSRHDTVGIQAGFECGTRVDIVVDTKEQGDRARSYNRGVLAGLGLGNSSSLGARFIASQ